MTILVEMVSDIVCPWCWLGLRRINAAIAQLDDPDDVELRFRPFQLSPELPPEGASYKDYMREKFGGSEAAKANWAAMKSALIDYGEAEGISFRFDKIERRPNTLNAHRLVRWAQGQGLGVKAKETLFDAFFHQHLDIGDKAVLVQLSETIGLHQDVVEKLLNENSDLDSVRQEELFFRGMGVSGVPTFIVERRFAAQGAQDVDQLVDLLKRAQDETEGQEN